MSDKKFPGFISPVGVLVPVCAPIQVQRGDVGRPTRGLQVHAVPHRVSDMPLPPLFDCLIPCFIIDTIITKIQIILKMLCLILLI